MTTFSAQLRARPAGSAAVIAPGLHWTTEELWCRAAAAADWLDDLGVAPGASVPAVCASSPDAIALFVGAVASGRVLAPLGARLTAAELTAPLAALPASVVVADEEAAQAGVAASKLGLSLAPLPRFGLSSRALEFDAPADAIALVLHTGGTTGQPKPVAIRQDRLARRVEVNAELLGFSEAATYATASGFHHIAGLGMFVVALGSGAAVAPYLRFSPSAWRSLEALGVTHGFLVPTAIELLLRQGSLHSGRLEVLQYGSAPIHPETLEAAMAELPGVDWVQMFGQTEGSPITVLTADDHRLAIAGRPELLSSVGRAAPGIELRLEPGPDGVGEVLARGAHLFKVDPDGWLHTGDLGRLDEEGYLYLAGRRGDRIIRGGENVYPVEVEDVLLRHPAVREAAVIGIPDREWGETVKAVVVVDATNPPSPEELREFCRRELAGIKVPTLWEFRDALPRSAQGKVLRRLLRDAAAG